MGKSTYATKYSDRFLLKNKQTPGIRSIYIFPHISLQYVIYGTNSGQYNVCNPSLLVSFEAVYIIPNIFDNLDFTI